MDSQHATASSEIGMIPVGGQYVHTVTPEEEVQPEMFINDKGEHFYYTYPLVNHRHHLFMSKNTITAEFEEKRKRRYFSKTVQLSHASHISVNQDRGKRRWLYSNWSTCSWVYAILMTLTLICLWVGVSPTRSIHWIKAGCSFAIISHCFLCCVLLALYFKPLHQWFAWNPKVPRSVNKAGNFFYIFSFILTLGTLICACRLIYLADANGTVTASNIYFRYITCKELDSSSDDSDVFAGICDDSVLRWIQSFLIISFLNIVCIIMGQRFFFGRFLPIIGEKVVDRINKPVSISFHGPYVAGFPLRVMLARADAERVITAFYANYNRELAPPMKIRADGVQYGDGGMIAGVVNYFYSTWYRSD